MDTFLLLLRVALALSVVVVLLWMAQRRFSQGARQRGQSVVEVVGRRNVGQKSSVVVIDSDGQRFLLGVTEQSINVLHSGPVPLPEPEDTAANTEEDTAFEAVLKAAGEPGLRRQAAARRLQRAEETGALHGTIFARSTWVQAGAAVRKGLNL